MKTVVFVLIFLVCGCTFNGIGPEDCKSVMVIVNSNRGCVEKILCGTFDVTENSHFYMGVPTCTMDSSLFRKVLQY